MNLEKLFVQRGYTLSPGTHRICCPVCGGGSTKEKCMIVDTRDGKISYICFRNKCGVSSTHKPTKPASKRVTIQLPNDLVNAGDILLASGIPSVALDIVPRVKYSVRTHSLYYPILSWYGQCIGYVQRRYPSISPDYSYAPKAINILTEETEDPLAHFPHLTHKKFNGTLYLVEDIPSAEALNKHTCAAALLGTGMTHSLVSLLVRIGVTDLRICLDQDAQATAFELQRQWSILFENFSIVLVDKDPKDMTEEQLHVTFGTTT